MELSDTAFDFLEMVFSQIKARFDTPYICCKVLVMKPEYLEPTDIIDSGHKVIVAKADSLTSECKTNPIESAIRLYYFVRDEIRYDPYYPFYLPKHYRASNVLAAKRGYCVPKASLLCALARASGIPARIGLATVRNHLATRQLIEYIGSDRFVCHGYTDLYLDGKWVKATPAFNSELCERFGVFALEFDGLADSVFQEFNSQNKPFMEYLEYTGTYSDVPVQTILEKFKKAYGEERVNWWIKLYEKTPEGSRPDFYREDII